MFDQRKFLDLVKEVMDIDAGVESLDVPLASLEGWDSFNAMRLMMQLEAAAGVRLPVARFLEAGSLREIYDLAAAGVPA